ncbi:hypothetical protein WBK31_17245 [Nonomuraea sp. N2-4H]|uniref:hypothetical protein n=1 Tax=Nonomuraea sp. N2-4H TaxID=3128898 RepID=UPI00324DE0FA
MRHGWPWTFWHWSKVVDVWHELMTGVLGHERYAAAGCDVERVFSKDDLLTHAAIYWAGESIASSIRTYANNNRYPWTPSHGRWPVVEAPTGITFVGYENPPGVTTGEQRIAVPGERPGGLVQPRRRHLPRSRRALHPVGDPAGVGVRPAPHVPRPPLTPRHTLRRRAVPERRVREPITGRPRASRRVSRTGRRGSPGRR